VYYAGSSIPKFIIDKRIPYTSSLEHLTTIEKPATEGLAQLKQILLEKYL
jgi:NAD-dependent deacetylase